MKTVHLFILLTTLFAGGAAAGAGAVVVLHERPRAAPDPSEAMPRSWEATVLLPLDDNDGRPIPKEKWERAVALFVEKFGGATLGAPLEGCDRDGMGKLRREPLRPVIVSFDRGRLDEFRKTLAEVGRLLEQESVYARIEEPRILLVTVDAKSSSHDP